MIAKAGQERFIPGKGRGGTLMKTGVRKGSKVKKGGLVRFRTAGSKSHKEGKGESTGGSWVENS